MLLLLTAGCLIERDLYEARRAYLLDGDADGYTDAAEGGDDCDDTDATVFPGATEAAYDGVDQDCDGSDLVDVDRDGVTAEQAGGEDCDDSDAGIRPGVDEIAYDDVGNLRTLCGPHHRLIHDGLLGIERLADGRTVFVHGDGRRSIAPALGPHPTGATARAAV